MKRTPITRARSTWEPMDAPPLPSETPPVAWRRRVHDGTLRAFLTKDPGQGWHLSVSWSPNGPRQASRYPTWDELADARYALAPEDVTFSMELPPPSEYVALQDTTFHLHEVAR